MIFPELPTLIRRVFDSYLTEYVNAAPTAQFRQDGDPRLEAAGYVIPFVDQTTSARYEVTIAETGEVVGTRQP